MKRQQIIDALKVRLSQIKTVNGYNTDIGNAVYEWRKIPFEPEELPAINIMDIANKNISLTNLEVQNQLTIQIDIIEDGQLLKQTVRQIIADVLKAVGQDETLGGLVEYMRYEEDSFQVEQLNSKELGVCSIILTAVYFTDRWEI